MATRDGREGHDQDIPNYGVPGAPSAGAPIARKGTPESSRPIRFRRVCGWCHELLDAGDPGAPTTDDCCLACYARERVAGGLPPDEGLPPAQEDPRDVEAIQRFCSDDATAYLRGLGLEPMPGAVGL